MSSILEVQPFIKLNQDNYEFAAHQVNLIESVTAERITKRILLRSQQCLHNNRQMVADILTVCEIYFVLFLSLNKEFFSPIHTISERFDDPRVTVFPFKLMHFLPFCSLISIFFLRSGQ